ncbi:Glutamyl-tRNA(Gln) amidotransferase subunit A [Geodia barretti]|uniref:Glutamyl-tRNA(Gln) amidotransferase subunit A n=2 Tax=Geodia barretti TaxID=519541 RepID=A0AA35WII5_GEOBA|nr:Glutamyl-tRNA(Gln) amidotransferase subunit A [Geodia barretti]
MSAWDLSRLIRDREVSPVDVVEACLARIEETEPTLNSFITLMPEQARDAARRAEAEIGRGNYRGPLHGIPVGLKDLFNTAGVKTTSGTRIYDNYVPDEDCTVAARFSQAGAILLGKLNMHPLAFGPTGENGDYGHMHNPWNPERITGGSSGGSGSATAAGQCTITMGSDTGGSVRIPAALCGIVGLKPTYGRVSRAGLTPLSWCLDHPGPMVRTVEDAALTMNVIAGHDPLDHATSEAPVPDYTTALTGDIRGLRIGVIREYFETEIDPAVAALTHRAIAVLGELGAEIVEVSLPLYEYAQPISNAILSAEATAAHRDILLSDGEKLYPQVRERLEEGLFISAAEYLRAQQARQVFCNQVADLLRDVDLLAGPVEPVTAPKILERRIEIEGQSLPAVPMLTKYTRVYNITGSPAISVPCGFAPDGLPAGLHLAGRNFDEMTVLRAAYAYQQATGWHAQRPAL